MAGKRYFRIQQKGCMNGSCFQHPWKISNFQNLPGQFETNSKPFFQKYLEPYLSSYFFLKAPASFALGGPPIVDLPERTRSGVPEGSSKAFRPFHAPSPAKAPEGRARWNASPQRLRRAELSNEPAELPRTSAKEAKKTEMKEAERTKVRCWP